MQQIITLDESLWFPHRCLSLLLTAFLPPPPTCPIPVLPSLRGTLSAGVGGGQGSGLHPTQCLGGLCSDRLPVGTPDQLRLPGSAPGKGMLSGLGLGQDPAPASGRSQPALRPSSPGTVLSALTEEDPPGHQGDLGAEVALVGGGPGRQESGGSGCCGARECQQLWT